MSTNESRTGNDPLHALQQATAAWSQAFARMSTDLTPLCDAATRAFKPLPKAPSRVARDDAPVQEQRIQFIRLTLTR